MGDGEKQWVLTWVPFPPDPPISFPALPIPYPIADTGHDFFSIFPCLIDGACHDELVTIVPIPFRDLILPVAAVVFGGSPDGAGA